MIRKPNVKIESLLEQILDQLKKPADIGQPVRKEWYPLFFHLYAKGNYVSCPEFGSSKWGFKKVEDHDLRMDYDYEFHSLVLHTENLSYKPAIRLMINGKVYPEHQRMCSTEANFDNWRKFSGHNYNYQRCYMFWVDYGTSQFGTGKYPFKMIVRKPWDFNIQFFATTTSNYFYSVEILGWKLFYDTADVVKELENVVKF